MKSKNRKPNVVNKYGLKPKDIKKAIVLNRERLKEKPFWYNSAINAYCLSEGVGKGLYGGSSSDYWIGIYDEDAKSYAGKVCYSCNCWEGMGTYKFESFFDFKEIENNEDLELQEKFLARINWLIDEGIIGIPGIANFKG